MEICFDFSHLELESSRLDHDFRIDKPIAGYEVKFFICFPGKKFRLSVYIPWNSREKNLHDRIENKRNKLSIKTVASADPPAFYQIIISFFESFIQAGDILRRDLSVAVYYRDSFSG